MDGDDIPVRSLKTFTGSHELTFNYQLEEMNSENIAADTFVPSQGSETFLLIGSHEHNADTMILLHCDSENSQIKMLSIPRDLYFNGRKINSIYRQYGPQRLTSELSDLTGLSITKYIAIDMYAFIDVVNILGGIDVSLDEALVDPTYKVMENGRWSTLYYSAGTHHLDGIAALRIARSRHTSSDFERAVRQQKVIAALKDIAGNMSITDMNTIYDLIRTTGKYVQSNLSSADMVKYFLSYKDYKITGQHVMNTDNILYASYTNLFRLTAEEQATALEDASFYKGGWIVLPKENDWSIIKAYIRSVLTSS
jgi:LCP family protein required for cell wall assembly